MMDVALTLLALIAGGLTFELFTISTFKREDFGILLSEEELYAGNPS